ncbi:MAG: energy transducer TonB [Mucilaginibacter sp.]
MIISKFNLCKSEWLELVFADRNKEYGAYYLRQHNAGNVIRAMGITFVSVTAMFIGGHFLLKQKPVENGPVVVVSITPLQPPVAEPPKPHQQPSAPKQLAKTTQFLQPVVTSQPIPTDPPKIDVMKGTEVGPVTIEEAGDGKGTTSAVDGSGGSGTSTEPKVDESIHNMGETLEVMPEPFGGAAAWAKFLQKNLRYPIEASEKGISGKVYVSFIVEKDGRLSSFLVERGVGYGMDEEALRVLHKAPAWKPGKQNGQPVRVKYTLPLNFVLNNDN